VHDLGREVSRACVLPLVLVSSVQVRDMKAEGNQTVPDQPGADAANGNLQTTSGEPDPLRAFDPGDASACQWSKRYLLGIFW
jgi:hypothetical protein